MAVTYEQTCVCGAAVAYTGHRRGEREAKDAWERVHAAHGTVPTLSAVATVAEPEPAPPKQSRRQMREAAAGAGR